MLAILTTKTFINLPYFLLLLFDWKTRSLIYSKAGLAAHEPTLFLYSPRTKNGLYILKDCKKNTWQQHTTKMICDLQRLNSSIWSFTYKICQPLFSSILSRQTTYQSKHQSLPFCITKESPGMSRTIRLDSFLVTSQSVNNIQLSKDATPIFHFIIKCKNPGVKCQGFCEIKVCF